MNPVAEMTISAMREGGGPALPIFEEVFNSALETHEVPFGTRWYSELYREKARDPQWFATSLILNAEKEGEGARRLWEMAGCTGDLKVADLVRRHAIDEARHAKIYLAMFDTVFPGCADDEVSQHMSDISPGYTLRESPERSDVVMDFSYTLDELIQMNLGEVRTRINQLMLEPIILAYCPSSSQSKISKLLNSIITDETKHISYTAVLIEKAAQLGYEKLVRDIMFGRLNQFCELTVKEVGAGTFEGS